MRKKLSTGTT